MATPFSENRIRHSRRGYTLLELMLALTLAGFVLAAIGMAIDLHLRALDSRRTNVEEAEVARAVLRRLADDLRSAVAYTTIDFSSIEELAANALPEEFDIDDLDGVNDNPDAPPDSGAGDPLDDLGADLPLDGAEEGGSLASRIEPPPVVGVYGNRYELQIDISRLPRIDEYSPIVTEQGEVRSIPSDVKTVTWYLVYGAGFGLEESGAGLGGSMFGGANASPTRSSGQFAGSASAGATGQQIPLDPRTGLPLRGLIRRELDRAVTAWGAQNGTLPEVILGDVMAPEVTELEFRYFDGTRWLDNWDSERYGGLPMAVEIAIAVEPSLLYRREFLPGMLAGGSTETEFGHLIYRTTVQLPSAQPIDTQSILETPLEGDVMEDQP